MFEWINFFKKNGTNNIQMFYHFMEYSCTVEEMYQAFKERMLQEIKDQEENQ